MSDTDTSGRKTNKTIENIYVPICVFLAVAAIALAITVGVLYNEGQFYKKKASTNQEKAEDNLQLAMVYKQQVDDMKKTNKPCKTQSVTTTQNMSSLSPFDDLTPHEYKAVAKYLTTSLGLTKTKRAINSSYILLMDLELPKKSVALNFLDDGGGKPERQARAVVYHGDREPPVVVEYVVNTNGNALKAMASIPWNKRPMDDVETETIDKLFLMKIAEELYPLLMESYKASYHNCSDRCLTWSWINPAHHERQIWFYFTRAVNNENSHPLGFQILFNVSSVNVQDWRVVKLVYNFQSFDSVHDLLTAYKSGNLAMLDLPWPSEYSTQKKRPATSSRPAKMAPEMFEPDGKRYTVNGRHIEYMGWSFDFRLSTTRGLQLYDIRFNDERIVYELGAQETVTLNSGKAANAMHYRYIESVDILGWNTFELFRGVDCPRTAVFFDVHQYRDGDVKLIKNAICVFELDAGIPLRRHYSQNFDELGNFIDYGGLADHVLVLRTIASLTNYDQIYDYIFHQNGAIEVKSTNIGYAYTTFFGLQEQEKRYAFQVYPNVSAPVNQVLINYKIDLDIQGTSNRFGRINIREESASDPWMGGSTEVYHVGNRYYAKNESDFPLKMKTDEGIPAYYLTFNDVKKNKYDHHRAYRLKNENPTEVFLTPGKGVEPGISWSRYPVAITAQKDDEVSSSSIYNGITPTHPVVDFQSFIDGDNLKDQDIVAWVTIGGFRLPSSNEMPTETSTSLQMKFLLLPFNYHDEDPSMTSPNSVYVDSDGKVERYGTPSSKTCLPPMESNYKYNGKVVKVP